MQDDQYQLPFADEGVVEEDIALWTPREIWVKLNQRQMRVFAEGRRIDYKSATKIDFEDLAIYLSMFSNTVDGGVIVYGAQSDGEATGCSKLPATITNRIEKTHLTMCPQARPEIRRFAAIVGGLPNHCIAIYIPYIGKLVETNKGEAWIRYGDSKHKMSDEEKRDFRSTRQERSFELERAPYSFPADFDLMTIQDFCDASRLKEGRAGWTNQEVLVDRQLGQIENRKFHPLNSLVLLAAKNPRNTIPGCRVRVQRFTKITEGIGGSLHEYSPVVDKYVEGNIVKLIVDGQRVIEETIYPVTWLDKSGKFVTTPEYPRWAWFEALVNALVHRSYSFSGSEVTVKFFPDRVEIESPGGFVPPVNEKTIYHARSARNLHLMDAMRVLRYVQMSREGTRRIKSSMEEWGLPEPSFRQEALHGVLVR